MNILFFSSVPTTTFGGPKNWAYRLISELLHQKHRVFVFTWGKTSANNINWGPDFYCLPVNQLVRKIPLVGFWYMLLTAGVKAKNIVIKNNIDVVHTLNFYEMYSISLNLPSPTALVLSLHGDYLTEQNRWWKSRWRRRLYLPIERYAIKHCDTIITSSNWLRNRLSPIIKNTPCSVIPNGIRIPEVVVKEPIQEKIGLQPDSRLILTLNNLLSPHRRRGLELLIKAAPIILEQVPNARFIVAGGVNDKEKDIELLTWAKQKAEGLPFFFTGYLTDPPYNLIKDAELYIHPSYLDNSPLSVMEAMALSKPVVATNVGGIPEIIDDKINGLLVPPEPYPLANAVLLLLKDQGFAQTLGNRAKEKAEKTFSWTQIGEQYLRIYSDAIFNHRQGVTN